MNLSMCADSSNNIKQNIKSKKKSKNRNIMSHVTCIQCKVSYRERQHNSKYSILKYSTVKETWIISRQNPPVNQKTIKKNSQPKKLCKLPKNALF